MHLVLKKWGADSRLSIALLLAVFLAAGCTCGDPGQGSESNGEEGNGEETVERTCAETVDCHLGEICADGVCVPYTGAPTPPDGCVADTDCADDERCATWSGECVHLADTQPPADRPTAVCLDGDQRTCGVSKVGACRLGHEICEDGQWSGECVGNLDPQPEQCDGQDNDCSGVVDNDTDALCDDDNPCTGTGACIDGGCVNLDPIECGHLDDQCNVGVCDPADGSCNVVPVTDGTACEGSSLCAAATCQAGECVLTGEPLDCSELNTDCSVGVCDASTGTCTIDPINQGDDCDDGDLCTEGSTCDAGVCQTGEAVDCSGLSDDCNAGICNAETGSCEAQPINDLGGCDDGTPCTVNAYCDSGTCFPGQPLDCSGLGDQCSVGACDPETDQCTTVPDPETEGADCVGDDLCFDSVCDTGECVATTNPSVDCGPWDVSTCAVGTCDSSTGECYSDPINEGTACDDGDACFVSVCDSGQCDSTGEPTIDCSSYGDDECSAGQCEPATGECYTAFINQGLACDDGIICTGGAVCEDGVCLEGSDLDCSYLDDACYYGECDPDASQCVAIQYVFPCLDVVITSAPDALTWNPDAIFEFECSDPPCEFECRINGGEWEPCDSPEAYEGLPMGTHTFEVRARKDGGLWSDPASYTWEIYIPTCEDAAADRLYIGCEYWPVVLSNSGLSSAFHGDFAVTVTNPLPVVTATVRIYEADNPTAILEEEVPPGELRTFNPPWNAMDARDTSGEWEWCSDFDSSLIPPYDVDNVNDNDRCVALPPVSKRGRIAYRLESDVPVNAYQFNPIVTQRGGNSSHTNDASLLLPAHVLGDADGASRYFAVTLPHLNRYRYAQDSRPAAADTHLWAHQPAFMAVTAISEGTTQVTLRSRGATAGGDGIPEINPGQTVTFQLDQHEVLQLASRSRGPRTEDLTVRESGPVLESTFLREYPQSDMTGSLVESDKPVAVFGGADCRFVPFDKWACDHLEQQLFPVANLGWSYFGGVAKPPVGGNDFGDYWRLVAVQDGTVVSFTPSVHPTVTLDAGEWAEFVTNQHFHVESQGPDYPIVLSQFLVGQQAQDATAGDPSMILPVPIEQYRQQFMFTTVQGIAQSHINVVRPNGATVRLNGETLPAGCWESLPGNEYEICRYDIPSGVSTLVATTGIGLIVYGYDDYVSYGYTGGLGLLPTTAINPDW